jgi:uncharacterized protein YoxC
MTGDLGTTNIWLAIIALVSLFEFLIIVAVAVMGWRLYQKVSTTVEQIEQRHIAPISAKVHHLVGEMQEVTRRVKHAEESVRGVITNVEQKARVVADVAQRAWPVLGGIRAVRAAVNAFTHSSAESKPRLVPGPAAPWNSL